MRQKFGRWCSGNRRQKGAQDDCARKGHRKGVRTHHLTVTSYLGQAQDDWRRTGGDRRGGFGGRDLGTPWLVIREARVSRDRSPKLVGLAEAEGGAAEMLSGRVVDRELPKRARSFVALARLSERRVRVARAEFAGSRGRRGRELQAREVGQSNRRAWQCQAVLWLSRR